MLCTEQLPVMKKGVRIMESTMGIRAEKKKRPADFCMLEDHAHEDYELFYLMSGRCRIFLNHTIYHMKAGDMLLIEPYALHRTMYGITQENERIDVMFDQEQLCELLDRCGKAWLDRLKAHPYLPVESGRRPYVEHIFQKLMAEQQNEDVFSAIMKKNYLFELMAFIGRHESASRQLPNPDIQDIQEQEAPIQQAAKYIYTHFDEQLTLDTVAELVHMSPTYFSRRFKQITGFGYKEYVNYVRLKEASRLLLETNLSLNEIARKCGFSDSNYFGDLFKKEKGMSPRMYRRNPQM